MAIRTPSGGTYGLTVDPYEVVGVMPADFDPVGEGVKLWVPLALTDQQKSARPGGPRAWMFGRLKSGATLQQARSQIDALNTRNLERFPFFATFVTNAGFHTIVVPLQDDLVRDVRGVLYLLWAGVAFVLLIGCVNIANLILFRASARTKELRVRLALGAGRWRLARQLMTETVLLTLSGAVVGLLLGAWCLEIAGIFGVDQLPRAREIGMNVQVVGLTLVVAFIIGTALGLMALAGLLTSFLQTAVHHHGGVGSTGRTGRLVQQGLVTAQVSITLILVTGAVLLFASFHRILSVDPGFPTDRLLTATVDLPPSRYENAEQRPHLHGSCHRANWHSPGSNGSRAH